MIGTTIQFIRETRGLSKLEFAEILGVSRTTVVGWENGTMRPSIDKIELMVEVLKVSPNQLFSYYKEDESFMKQLELLDPESKDIAIKTVATMVRLCYRR